MAIDPVTGQEIPQGQQQTPAARPTFRNAQEEYDYVAANEFDPKPDLGQDAERLQNLRRLIDIKWRRAGAGNQVTGDEGNAGQLEAQSFSERSALPVSGTPLDVQDTYFDNGRGVTVHAPVGKMFQLYSGGGVRLVDAASAQKTAGTAAGQTSLFGQETQGGQAVAGYKQEQLGIAPAAGKTIARTGQTIKNPTTGVDEYANPGEILIEYTDGTVERRKVDSINQPGQTTPIGEFGRTADELGITRQTEIKGGAGEEVTRAPMTAAQALAQAKTPEEMNAIIQKENLASTADLEFIGSEYTDQKTGQRRVARPGYSFYQEPGSDTVLERPSALKPLAKETTSPSILAEREANQKLPGQASVEQILSDMGFNIDGGALANSFQSNPIKSFQDLYASILQQSGVPQVKAEIEKVQKDQKDLDAQYADEISEINSNPWLSEADRSRRTTRTTEKYEIKRSQLTAQLQLYTSLQDDAREEARFISTSALAQYNADRQFDLQQMEFAAQRAEARLDAQIKLAGLDLQRDQLEVQKSQFAQNLALQSAQFKENVRQFGLSYALDVAKANQPKDVSEFESLLAVLPQDLREKAIYEKLGVSELVGGEDNQLAQDSLLALQALKENKGLKSAVGTKGLSSLFGALDKPIAGTPAANFLAELERVKSLITLPNLQYLKGKGAMSDKDLALITSAASSLNPSMSNKAFTAELDRMIGVMQKAVQKVSGIPQAGQKFMGGTISNVQEVKGFNTTIKPMQEVSYLTQAERELFTKESGLNPLAKNPNSTAFGIWQGIKSNRDFYGSQLGIDPNTTDFNEQLAMGRAYIQNTYGTAERANAFWNATKQKNPSLAPADLQGKARTWISKGYVGY